MAVNRQKIWQINFNKYNAVGGGLKCCHPLNYKNTTVNQSPPCSSSALTEKGCMTGGGICREDSHAYIQ